jgi:hypothetical protein
VGSLCREAVACGPETEHSPNSQAALWYHGQH